MIERNIRNIYSYSFTILFLCVVFFLAADAYGFPEKTERWLGIDSKFLISPFLISSFLMRLRFGTFLSSKLKVFASFLALCVSSVLMLLTAYEYLHFPNAAFSATKFHLDGLLYLVFFTVTTIFLNVSNAWFGKHWKGFLFVLPLASFFALQLAQVFPFNFFREFVKEDHFIEYSQFFILLFGGILHFAQSMIFLKQKNVKMAVFTGLLGAFYAVVAGDEISWGQRIFGFQSSEVFLEHNRQDEVTFHNLYIVEWLVIYAYLALSYFGAFSKNIMSRVASANSFVQRYIQLFPDWWLFSYFFPPVIFFTAQISVSGGKWQAWSEVAELSLYTSLVFWTVSTILQAQTRKRLEELLKYFV